MMLANYLIFNCILATSVASDSSLCHELKNIPIQTAIIERFKDSLGNLTKAVPPIWGNPWYSFGFTTPSHQVEIFGAIHIYPSVNTYDLLYNGEFWITTNEFECGCKYNKRKLKCLDWTRKHICCSPPSTK